MTNPNAESQQRRRDRLTAAAKVAGFQTIDQLARQILTGSVKVVSTFEYETIAGIPLDDIEIDPDRITVSH